MAPNFQTAVLSVITPDSGFLTCYSLYYVGRVN